MGGGRSVDGSRYGLKNIRVVSYLTIGRAVQLAKVIEASFFSLPLSAGRGKIASSRETLAADNVTTTRDKRPETWTDISGDYDKFEMFIAQWRFVESTLRKECMAFVLGGSRSQAIAVRTIFVTSVTLIQR